MTAADIQADAAATRPRNPPRRLWPWVLAGAIAATLLAAGGLAALLLSVFDGLRDSAHIVSNGQAWHWQGGQDWSEIWRDGDWADWADWADWGDWGDWGEIFGSGVGGFIVGAVGLLLVGLVLALIVVPCVVLAVGLAGLGVAFAVAAVLGSVALVVALVVAPLCLFALLLWLVWRRRPQRALA